MFCKDCLEKAVNKLLPTDITILEYLNTKKATIPQCQISREVIRDDLNLTKHICYTSLYRLDCFDFVEKNNSSKANKYHVTEGGIKVLAIFEDKMSEVS